MAKKNSGKPKITRQKKAKKTQKNHLSSALPAHHLSLPTIGYLGVVHNRLWGGGLKGPTATERDRGRERVRYEGRRGPSPSGPGGGGTLPDAKQWRGPGDRLFGTFVKLRKIHQRGNFSSLFGPKFVKMPKISGAKRQKKLLKFGGSWVPPLPPPVPPESVRLQDGLDPLGGRWGGGHPQLNLVHPPFIGEGVAGRPQRRGWC